MGETGVLSPLRSLQSNVPHHAKYGTLTSL